MNIDLFFVDMDNPEVNNKSETEHYVDPFEGYASCPDTRRAYLSYSKENQTYWLQKSEEAIRKYLARIHSFKSFREAYAFLAGERHQIAIDLKQRTDEGRTDYYGCFRNEGDHMRQSVSSGDGEQFWKWQKNMIFELTYNLVAPVKKIKLSEVKPGYIYEDKYLTCLKENVFVDDKEATYYCITTKFPADLSPADILHSTTLSQIELYDFGDNKRFNLIRIEYTPIDNQTIAGNYAVVDSYYQALLHWKPDDGVEKFLSDSAKLAFLTANFLFVKQGNSGIIEWMLRAMAFKHGIDLGRFNHAENISWDFKAILTPDLSDYVKWYTLKLFNHYSVHANQKTEEFSFIREK